MASTRDFLLIFGECATLMCRNALSRGYLKFAFSGPVTMSTTLFDRSWDPHIFFQLSSTQNNPYIEFILHAKFEKSWIVRS